MCADLEPKKVSESKRRRDVNRYYSPELRGIDISALLSASPDGPIPPHDHIPALSSDGALNAFAQLAAIRLNSATSLISLIDASSQYILAEAGPDLLLGASQSSGQNSKLWLGNTCIPRGRGVCEAILELDIRDSHGPHAVVFNDLSEHEKHKTAPYVTGGPQWRFYAGFPLISKNGAIIGAICVFDHEPRPHGLSSEMAAVLEGLSTTTVSHLEILQVKTAQRRGDRMVRGLVSFLEGASELLMPEHAVVPKPSSSPRPSRTVPTSDPISPSQEVWTSTSPMHSRTASTSQSAIRPPTPMQQFTNIQPEGSANIVSSALADGTDSAATPIMLQSRRELRASATSKLQESILPTNARLMFSRAANVIRETSELDGVVFFDASIAGISGKKKDRARLQHGDESSQTSPHGARHDNQSSSYSDSSNPSDHRHISDQRCQILGYSGAGKSSVEGDAPNIELQSLLETDLERLLKAYSKGKILNFHGDLEKATSSEDSRGNVSSTDDGLPERSKTSTGGARSERLMNALQAVAPGARSLAVLPLWDYERSRWFACCLLWTTKSDRLLSPATDLVYLKAFGNSVMIELSRLDEIASNRTKTAFVASISHELRSPLHGVLGGAEFLQTTQLDAFQTAMLHSISTCGRTLLDTLNHVLDYAKINEFSSGPSTSITRITDKKIRASRKRPQRSAKQMNDLSSVLNLGVVTEEVVEAVFAGQSYRVSSNKMDDLHMTTPSGTDGTSYFVSATAPGQNDGRKLVLVVLDISREANWKLKIPAGAWRRVLMNLFGNALKYTQSGYVKVSLMLDKTPLRPIPGHVQVVLTVTDSGTGISQEFLANRLYTPFSQENTFSSGIGLGLSIVRQIVESLRGNIEISSNQGEGTTVTVKLSMPNAEEPQPNDHDPESIAKIVKRVQGKSITILHKSAEIDPQYGFKNINDVLGAELFAKSLSETLTNWFSMTPVVTSSWTGHNADIVICTEPSFEYLNSIREAIPPGGKAPITLFLAIDAIEAAALRNDARVLSRESVVEIISQPCGPFKLAKIIDHCLTRYYSSEHIKSPSAASSNSGDDPAWSGSDSASKTAIKSPLPSNKYSVPPVKVGASLPQKLREIGVLVVDDSSLNRRLLVALMKKHKIKYREAVDGLDALNKYKETPAAFDFILMDLSMPVMDGMSSTRNIRMFEAQNNLPRTTIIALTGLASASARLEAFESGVDQYRTKPVQFSQLIRLFGIYADDSASSTSIASTPIMTAAVPSLSRESNTPTADLNTPTGEEAPATMSRESNTPTVDLNTPTGEEAPAAMSCESRIAEVVLEE